jgi:hypothetical protein
LDLTKVDARVLRHFIGNEAVNANIGSWVHDLGSYRARATLYSKVMDLYWILKTLMGKVLVERNEAHKEIFLQLDDVQRQLRVMDHNINMIVGIDVRLDFANLDLP